MKPVKDSKPIKSHKPLRIHNLPTIHNPLQVLIRLILSGSISSYGGIPALIIIAWLIIQQVL